MRIVLAKLPMLPMLAKLPMLLVALMACGSNTRQVTHDFDQPADEQLDLEGPTSRDEAAEPELTGAVSRAALLEVLDAGPGAFLSGIDMKAHFEGKRFDGWEIVHFWPGDARFAGVDVRPGDVISTVNGKGLQRPENLFDAWTSLREADEIVVSGERGGGPLELRFGVYGAAPAKGAREQPAAAPKRR